MKSKCDKCDRPAKIHLTEIVGGQKTEKHLCEHCAAEEGIAVGTGPSITQMLEEFVLATSDNEAPNQALRCDVCDLTFKDYRRDGQLGCPNDYDAFATVLDPMIERAQDGGLQHVGKVPHRAGPDQTRQMTLLRLRADLKGAVTVEDYERAAAIRDQISEMERE